LFLRSVQRHNDRNYHVRVTPSSVSFGYSSSCGQANIDRSQILTVEAIERINGLCQWGGWGIRYQLPTWEVGYLPKNGSGIRMTYTNKDDGKEKAYTFICNEAERVVQILTGEQA